MLCNIHKFDFEGFEKIYIFDDYYADMKKQIVLITFCISICVSWQASSQILQDQATKQLASQVLQNVYAMQYSAANTLTESIYAKYPKHPVYPFLKAYIISWENFPLTKQKTAYTTYNAYLTDCINLSLAMLKKNDEDVEGIFFAMMGYSLLALHESESGDFMSSVGYGRKAFSYMKKGFDLGNVLPDFNFSTGLYKYYAEQYPETHPIAKPVMAFFPGGNKQEGLQKLLLASQTGQFSKVESLLYLNSIYAKYEQNPYVALDCAYKLVTLYPNHPFFWMKYAEHLTALGRYAEAELYFAKYNTRTEKIYVIGANAIQGIVQEKYYKNFLQAKLAYQQATSYESYDTRYSQDYVAFAYVGMGRIAHQEGNLRLAREYYKKAQKIAEYESLKREIKEYLKN